MNAWPVEATIEATAAADGTAAASWTATDRVAVHRLAATGNSTATAVELRVYRNGILVDASGYANNDVSEFTRLSMHPGERIEARWSKASIGARMRLSIEGEATR